MSGSLTDVWTKYYASQPFGSGKPGLVWSSNSLMPTPGTWITNTELDVRHNSIENLIDLGMLIGAAEKSGRHVDNIRMTPQQYAVLKDQAPELITTGIKQIYGHTIILEQADRLWQ